MIGKDWELPRVSWARKHLRITKFCERQRKCLRDGRTRVSLRERPFAM